MNIFGSRARAKCGIGSCVSYWRFVGDAAAGFARASTSAAQSMGYGVNALVRSQGVRPSRRSIRRGILVPGDGPPTGAAGTFLDYREVLIPQQVTALQQGVFPLGRIQDPGQDNPGFRIYLDWEFIAKHVAVVGPPGSGKTFSIFAPWIVSAAEQGLTAVAVDVKGDLRQEISEAKARLGVSKPLPIVTWDISDPQRSRSWNPLSEISSLEHAAQVAMAFLGEVDPNDHQKFFAERDQRWLRGLLWLSVQALGKHTHPSVLYQLIVSQQHLSSLAVQVPQAAYEIVDLIRFDSSKYTDATAGLANRLSWLADPSLAAMLAGSGTRAFSLSQAVDSGAILLVGSREQGGERTAVAASIFLNLLRLKCLERFGGAAAPVFWVLDEARRYAHRVQLDQMLDLLRGANSPVCIGLQDVNHLGPESQQVRMLANCSTFITLTGVSQDTAKFFKARLGTVSAPSTSMTMDQTGTWRPSVARQERPLLGDREIMYPPVGHYGGVAQLRAGSAYPLLFSLS